MEIYNKYIATIKVNAIIIAVVIYTVVFFGSYLFIESALKVSRKFFKANSINTIDKITIPVPIRDESCSDPETCVLLFTASLEGVSNVILKY